MSEIFEIIVAINRLKEKVAELSKRVDYLSKYPSIISSSKYMDESSACKFLKCSPRSLRRLRKSRQIDFIQYGRKILYKTDSIHKFLSSNLNKEILS